MESPTKIWRRQKKVQKLLNKKGSIITWTMIYVAGHACTSDAPFPVVLVQLESGEKVYGKMVDFDEQDLAIGTKVISVLRKIRDRDKSDIIAYGLKFKPLKS